MNLRWTNSHSRGGTVALLTASLVLSGCATSPRYDGYSRPGTSLTPAEQRLRRQSNSLARTNTQACLTGGALAGMTMLLLSQGRRDAGERALVGAIAGCGVGIGANTYVQGKRRQYAYREDRLQSMLTEVRRDNARVSRLIATSETVIAADKKRITEADRAYANKTISLAQARRELAAVTDNRNHLKQTHARLSRKLNDWERVSEQERRLGSDTTALDQEIHRLRKQISDLEEELLLIDQRIRVSPISA